MDALRRVEYKDQDGRRFVRLIPVDAEDNEAEWGIPVGPPSLANLKLPLEMEVRLHNEMYHRDILTEDDIRNRRPEMQAALMAAYRADVETILATLAEGKEN